MDAREKDRTEEKSRNQSKSIDEEVCIAKIRFLKAAQAFNPLNFVDRHPKTSLGCAFCAGFGTDRMFKNASKLPFIPLAAQIARLLLKVLMP